MKNTFSMNNTKAFNVEDCMDCESENQSHSTSTEQKSCESDQSTQVIDGEASVEEVDAFSDMGNVESQKSWGSVSTIPEDDLNDTELCVSPMPTKQDLDDTICMGEREDEHDSGKDSGRGSTSPAPGSFKMDLSFQSSSTNQSPHEVPEGFTMACKTHKNCNKKPEEVQEGNEGELDQKEMVEQNEEHPDPEINKIVKLDSPFLINNVIESDTPIDMYISCKGGKIGVHRLVLAAVSPFLAHLFEDVPPGEPPVIVLPDVSGKVVETMICFIYTGRMYYPECLRDEVIGLMGMLMVGEHGRFSIKRVKVGPKKLPAPEPVQVPSSIADVQQTGSKPDTDQSTKREIMNTGSKDGDLPVPKQKKPKYKRIPGICGVLRNEVHQCALCPETRSTRSKLIRHVETSHQESYVQRPVSPNEKAELLNCSYCKKKFASFAKAQQCLSDHGTYRCYICLGVVLQKDFLQHMLDGHSVITKHGPFAKCRWCNISLEVSGSGLAMSRHTMAKHLSPRKEHVEEQKLQKKPLAPIFTAFMKKVSSKNKPNVAAPSPSKTRPKRNLKESPSPTRPNKRPKLDENGKPVYLSKRTGVPIGPKKPILDSGAKFHWGIQKSTTEECLLKFQKNGFIRNLPVIRVLVQPLNTSEVDQYVKKEIKEELSSDSPPDNDFDSNSADEKPWICSTTNQKGTSDGVKPLSNHQRTDASMTTRKIGSAVMSMQKELTNVQL